MNAWYLDNEQRLINVLLAIAIMCFIAWAFTKNNPGGDGSIDSNSVTTTTTVNEEVDEVSRRIGR